MGGDDSAGVNPVNHLKAKLLCQGIGLLLDFFRLLLSKETFHRFNRMALLGVLFFSLLIPCIEVTTRHQVEVQQACLLYTSRCV